MTIADPCAMLRCRWSCVPSAFRLDFEPAEDGGVNVSAPALALHGWGRTQEAAFADLLSTIWLLWGGLPLGGRNRAVEVDFSP